MRRVLIVLPVVSVLLASLALTQSGDSTAREATPAPAASGVVGSWRLRISPPQGEPYQSLITFAADGTLIAANVPVLPAPPGLPVKTLFSSAGYGVWEAAGEGAGFTFDIIVDSDTGMPIGTLTARGTATLGADGRTLSATYELTFTDPSGKVVSTESGRFTGTRMTVERPSASPAA